MTAKSIGLIAGPLAFLATLILAPPAGMPPLAWIVAGLTLWMAVWWMTEAVPLTVTALLPFIIMPLTGVMDANKAAASYYSPILFLILGGAFIALAIERTGLHRRLALAILQRSGSTPRSLLMAFMVATALLSAIISNTSTALIMMPMALAVLAGGGVKDGDTTGIAGALVMGIAFAASIGGLATLVGSPTNAIAAALLEKQLGLRIDFATWAAFGVPIVLVSVPIAALIIARVQRLSSDHFKLADARAAIAHQGLWSAPERRLIPIVALTVLAWITLPLTESLFPKGGLTDGTIAVIAGIALFLIPDGTGRAMLTWREANRAPWDVIMMFGGGLALAAGMTESGLAAWLGESLKPLSAVPLIVIAAVLVALVIMITEFASNVATASGLMPVVAGLIAALGVDPVLLAVPTAMAASWGFMLPSGTGPNAIAWSTGHVSLPAMLRAGFWLDLAGIPIIIGAVWLVAIVIS